MNKLIAVCLVAVCAAHWPLDAPSPSSSETTDSIPVPTSFDCAMRNFAYEHGKALLPRKGAFESLYNALGLNEECNGTLSSSPSQSPVRVAPVPNGAVHVSPTGKDGASCGSESAPCATIQHAADKAKASTGGTVVVHGGTYYLEQAVLLTAAHSGLTIQAAAGEAPVISGGVRLQTTWRAYNTSAATWDTEAGTNNVQKTSCDNVRVVCPGTTADAAQCQALCAADQRCTSYTWHDSSCKGYENQCRYRIDGVWGPRSEKGHTTGRVLVPARNVWVANVKGQVAKVPGLQLDGVRATRARYPNLPNGIEASCGYGCMVSGGSADWTPPDFQRFGPVHYYTDNRSATRRNDTDGWFNNYMIGVDGLCSVYDPPVGYWCSEHTSGGGAFAFRTPSGVAPKADALPHAPYEDVSQATHTST